MKSLEGFREQAQRLRQYMLSTMKVIMTELESLDAVAVMEGSANWVALETKMSSKPESSRGPIFDYQISGWAQTALVASICEETWLYCVENWKRRSSLEGCEYTIERNDIIEGLSAFGVICTGDTGYLDSAIQHISSQMYALGYSAKAQKLFEGTLDVATL